MENSQVPNGDMSNGVVRTTSRRRKPSGTGHTQYESFENPAPEAPEVPKAPPISYRDPPGGDPNAGIPYNNPNSFSARARRASTDAAPFPESPIGDKLEHMAQATRQNRRGSIRRSSVPKPVDDYNSSAHANAAYMNQTKPPQAHAKVAHAEATRSPDSAYVRQFEEGGRFGDQGTASASSPSTRRISGSGADPRKEWAVDRSPLQKLEGKLIDRSKEEKRAQLEEAENKLREHRNDTTRTKKKPETYPVHDESKFSRDAADVHRKSSNRRSDKILSNNEAAAVGPTLDTTRHVRREGDSRRSYNGPRQQNNVSQAVGRQESRSIPEPLYTDETVQPNYPSQEETQQREPIAQASQNRNRVSQSRDKDLAIGGRRYSQGQQTSQIEQRDATSRRGDVRFAPEEKSTAHDRPKKQVPKQQQGLYDHKAQSSREGNAAVDYGGRRDPLPREAVQSSNPGLHYAIPPETAAGIAAREKVAFEGSSSRGEGQPPQHHHRLSKLLHRKHSDDAPVQDEHPQQPRQLDEWRKASTARLTVADFASIPSSIADAPNRYNAWWEKDKGSRRAISGTAAEGDGGANDMAPPIFNPQLYLECGPLLRFTGIQRSKLQQSQPRQGALAVDREVWRGSVMIVTADSQSNYSSVPLLELFPEPMDLLPPPPHHVKIESGNDLPAAYLDPIAGLPRITRDGGVVYVRPAEDLDQERDLSRVESDDGLFEQTRTANVPTSYGRPNTAQSPRAPMPARTSSSGRRSNQRSVGSQVKGARLYAERGLTFWRFNIEIELTERPQRIGYRINKSASTGFWVPAKGQTMNMMFHSCNGFSMSVDPNHFSGPDPLWRDVLNNHQSRPFHVMIGGGDQIYNDRVMSETELFQEWLTIKNPHTKHQAPFSLEMRDELEAFYLERYCMWFSQGLFGMANSQIPMINVWDDHDIIDGFGSYPHHFMSTPVFCGLGAVAFKYYMLFQHQSVADEGSAEEPSWLMGASPGPYINELSRSLFMSLGKNVSFLGLDCRTERMRDEVLSEATYNLAFDRCRREIIEGETKHLIVLLGVPIAYPRLNFLENVLTSRVMDPIKALGRAGLLGGFINKFDGGVEILDDLDDHWTAKHHKRERNWFIQELQELAAEKSIRVTILGGDVHLAAIGQFYSSPKLHLTKDRDHRYMPNVISSAIVNTPPPELMADILNKRDKKHYVDKEDKATLEDMIPMFTHDVDGSGRNNKRLLPRRNWCSIREYHPGSTPPPTPPESEHSSVTPDSHRAPPTRLQRTLSLTRGDVKPGNLIRRLSGRARAPSPDYPVSNQYQTSPRMPTSPPQPQDDYFTQQPKRASTLPAANGNTKPRYSSAPLSRPGNFHRRPTNMSEKAVLKGGASDTLLHNNNNNENEEHHINLEHGLDICINCEVNQKDPAGITVPYRLLVPALWYEGAEDVNIAPYRKKSVLDRFRSIRLGGGGRKSGLARRQGQGEWGGGGGSGGGTDSYTPSISEAGGEPQHQQQQQQQQQHMRPVISNPIPLPRKPQEQDRGYTGRRLSKADRMLGTDPNATKSGAGAGAVFLGETFPSRHSHHHHHHYQHDDHADGDDGVVDNHHNNAGVILGAGTKTSSAGSRATGPQGLQTGNGSVKTRSAAPTADGGGMLMTRSGSRGYQAPPTESGRNGNGGVVLGRGEKVSSAARYEQEYEDGGDGYESEGSEGYSEDGRKGKGGGGYGGIEAYKERGWRRFF
ncbi:MAG: hypothetical protein Q9220_001412 [cf. Caloplaca sp. 1 TL-2023]